VQGSSFHRRFIRLSRLLAVSFSLLHAQGKVYLVLGSDTAIWDGMDVASYNCTYSLALYTDPDRNAYKVMDPAFRNPIVDSYGQTVKFTWWMMAGNIFRYATNRNVPLPNTMTLYLMNKYHGESVRKFGDELSLHYHTFGWTDYDGDGVFWWNQTHTFSECRDDFDVTVAQYLLEENTYPVSYRSGWHYMDNEWQRYLDSLLLFSMHDDWPAVRNDITEPIDNVYDWSKSSKEFVPFHPAPDNYQLPGSCKGWDLRSKHVGSIDSTLMNSIFSKANAGKDQVACLWGHLPETDFLDNIRKINQLAHAAAAKYPGVKFRYCTAVEAMQRWLGRSDTTAPVMTLREERAGDQLTFVIKTNEPIFQAQPFVAVKDLYERYRRLLTQRTGENEWTTIDPVTASSVAKVAAALTDTAGNVSTAVIRYLPDDLYIDNKDSGYSELSGSWTSVSNGAWGTDARTAILVQNDSVKVRWKPSIGQAGTHNIFVQFPSVQNAAGKITFRILNDGQTVATAYFENPLISGDWVYIGTARLSVDGLPAVEMVVKGDGQAGKTVAADVMKVSALVRDKQIVVGSSSINFGDVSESDTARYSLPVRNLGSSSLTITSISGGLPALFPLVTLPLVVGPMQSTVIPIGLFSTTRGTIIDSLFIASDDPTQPSVGLQVRASVQNYSVVIDNEDSVRYKEFGNWNFSNAQAYGASSRYAWITDGPGTHVRYSPTLKRAGAYDIQIIVPKTANASTRANYVLSVGTLAVDSTIIDQNVGSGTWVTILTRALPAAIPIDVAIRDATPIPVAGVVLRADAMKFILHEDVSALPEGVVADDFLLDQNYPNPFNPSTAISFQLPAASFVTLKVFDVLGREVATLVNEVQAAGRYTVRWIASSLPSGIYLYRIQAGGYVETRRMVLMK